MARYRKGQGKLFRKNKNGKPVGNWFFKYEGLEINTYTKDKEDAERERMVRVGLAASGLAISPFPKVGVLMDLHLEEYDLKGRGSKPSLFSRQKRLRPYFGERDAQSLPTTALRAYRKMREGQGASNPTIDKEFQSLRRALNIGHEEDLTTRVPSFKSVMSGEDNVRTGFIEPTDYERLRDALREPERLMFVLLYHTGWRVERVLSLKWDRVHLEGRFIEPPEKQYDNKKVGPAPIYGDLKRGLEVALMERDRALPGCRWVVHRASGARVVDYGNAWDAGIAAAGLEGLLVHDIRRTAVRNLLNLGLSEGRVGKITGQSKEMIKRYDIVADRDVARMARELDRKLVEDKAKSTLGVHLGAHPTNGVN